jgi:hypothetical protein
VKLTPGVVVSTAAKFSKTLKKKSISGKEIFNVDDEEIEVVTMPMKRSFISPGKFREKVYAIFEENDKKFESHVQLPKGSNPKAKPIAKLNPVKEEEVEPRVEVSIKRLVENLMKNKRQEKNDINVISEVVKTTSTRQPRGRKMKEESVKEIAEVAASSAKEDNLQVKVKVISKRQSKTQKPPQRQIPVKKASNPEPSKPEADVEPQPPQVSNPAKASRALNADRRRPRKF